MKKYNVKVKTAIYTLIVSIISLIAALIFEYTGIDISTVFSAPGNNTYISVNEEMLKENFINSDLSVCVMSIGQADSILISLGSKNMLIDCGESDDAKYILDKLHDLDIKKLDVLVLTHPHSDHIGGAKKVLEKIDVDEIYMPAVSTPTVTFDKLLDLLAEKEIPTIEAASGVRIPFGKAKVKIISPEAGRSSDNINSYSAVILFEYQGTKMLFCGDAEKENEDMILSSGYDINCDIIKIGHHGSKTSSSQNFVEAVSPRWAIATTMYDSPDNLPKEAVIKRWKDAGATVLCTNISGDIYAFVQSGILSVYTELSPSS